MNDKFAGTNLILYGTTHLGSSFFIPVTIASWIVSLCSTGCSGLYHYTDKKNNQICLTNWWYSLIKYLQVFLERVETSNNYLSRKTFVQKEQVTQKFEIHFNHRTFNSKPLESSTSLIH